MAVSKTLTLTLTLFLLSTLAFTVVQCQDIHKILSSFGLPPGLFPDADNHVSIESNGNMSLRLNSDCFVLLAESKTLLYYKKKISGMISYGRITDVKGIRMQQGTAWVPVTEIKFKAVDGTMEFHLGLLTELLPMDDFEKATQCQPIQVLKFRGIPFAELGVSRNVQAPPS